MNRLGDKLDLSALTVAGITMGEAVKDAEIYNDDVIKFLHTPVSSQLIEHPICNFVFDAVFHKTHPPHKKLSPRSIWHNSRSSLYIKDKLAARGKMSFLNHRI